MFRNSGTGNPGHRSADGHPAGRSAFAIDLSELVEIIRAQVAAFDVNLTGLTVVAGAAAGYDAVVATAAALAGAKHVIALTRESKRYPSAAEAAGATLALARRADVADGIEILNRIDSRGWNDVDLLVSCRQVWPISRGIVELLSPRSVVCLMGETWELQPGTVDIEACEKTGIKVAALDLGHPAVMLLPEFARLCSMLLDDAGIDPSGATIALLCDTPAAPFIEQALRERGASVGVFPHPLFLEQGAWDAVIVAMQPSEKPPMDIRSMGRIVETAREALLVQFSGEVDRSAASYFGLNIWPKQRPGRGQLGLPLSALGPRPIIRKLIGGLKAGEEAYHGTDREADAVVRIVKAEDEGE
jgi:hypothetical protein